MNHANKEGALQFCFGCKKVLELEDIIKDRKLHLIEKNRNNEKQYYMICTDCLSKEKKYGKKIKFDVDTLEDFDTDCFDKLINHKNVVAENEENFIPDNIKMVKASMKNLYLLRCKMLFMRKLYYRTQANHIVRNIKAKIDQKGKISKRNPWLCGMYGFIIFTLNYFVQRELQDLVKKFTSKNRSPNLRLLKFI